MIYKNAKGYKRIVNATQFSIYGFKAAWKSEEAFRQEVILSALLIPVGLFFGNTPAEKALLVLSCLVVVITELLNSAIEAAVDRIGLEKHPLSKQAKDMGSAAVFVSLMVVAFVWGIICFERFF